MKQGSIVSGLGADLRGAWRQHVAHPANALTIVGILACAIGLNTALYSMVHAVLMQPLPFAGEDRVVFVWNTQGSESFAAMAPARALDLREQGPFTSSALIGHISMTITGRGPAERWFGASVSSSFFDVLQAKTAIGRTFGSAEPNRDVVVISHRLWVDQFHGRPGVVGESLVMNGRARIIVGVMPADFYWPSITAEASAENPPLFWTCAPLPDVPERPVVFDEDITKNRHMGFLRFVARITPGLSADAAKSQLSSLATNLAAQYPQTDGGHGFNMVSARQQFFGQVERPLLFVLLASVLVVVAACVNVGNLMLVRLAGRRREFAVRSALGAGRWRVVRQLFAEAAVLAVVGGALGVMSAAATLRVLIAVTPASVGRLDHLSINSAVLFVSIGATALTGVVLGVLSAVAVQKESTADDLRTAGVGDTGWRRLRAALVSVEVAMAVALVAGAMLCSQSLRRLQRVDVGFDTARLLTFDVMLTGDRAEYQAKQLDFFEGFLARVRALPGVQHAAGAVTLPIGGDDFGAAVYVEGRPQPAPGAERKVGFQIVGASWFDTLGMRVMNGRDFLSSDTRQSTGVVIINHALAALEWPRDNPVGRQLRMGSGADAPLLTVVGVVSDIRHMGPGSAARPEIYLPYSQFSLPMMAVAVRTAGDPMTLVEAIRAAGASVDATQPISGVSTMDAHLKRSYSRARFLAILTGLFGALALALAAVGIYGVTSFAVAQRTRELGVRTALGASPLRLIRGVMSESLTPVVTGAILGLALAVSAGSAIRSLLFDVSPLAVSSYATAAAILFAAALAASALPARRAAHIDPVKALRDA